MTKLKAFQREDVDRIHELEGRVLLANEVGCGKTIEALFYLKESKAFPALVVCPAFLKLHWQREALQHCRMRSTILSSTRASKKALKGDGLFIINYEILQYWRRVLMEKEFSSLVADECHYLGNLRAKRTKSLSSLAFKIPHLLFLSGTPLTNRPWELFPLLHMLYPERYDSPFAFGHEFCEAKLVFGRWQFQGARNLKTLHKQLSGFMIRRKKKDVLGQLPPRRSFVVPLEIEKSKEYKEAHKDVVAWLSKTDKAAALKAKKAEGFARFAYLKQLSAKLKMKSMLAWLDSHFEETDGKVLMGVIHHATREAILDHYAKRQNFAVTIHGKQTSTKRIRAEESFRRSDTVRLLVGQMKACGVGINLPEASSVVHAEFPWAPGTVQQFAGRAHRLTSKNPVDEFFLVAHGTIEEDICRILDKKSHTLDMVLDGTTTDSGLSVYDELCQALVAREKK